MNCPKDCVWFYEEKDVNWEECKHPDHNEEDVMEECKHYYSRADAKADARYAGDDRY